MEQLNRIELRGIVGTVRVQAVGDTHVAKISLATDYIYKGRNGDPVIETTWHYITAWESKNMPDLNTIQRGNKLYAFGRLRSQRYTGYDGVERTSYDVVASKLQVIDTDEPLQCID